MKQLYLIHEHHPRLLLFFAGWAADETPFRHYRPQGMDYQICERRGIPPAIYQGTLDGLTGASLHKFLRRMCADSIAFRQFLERTPRRPLDEIRDELACIARLDAELPDATLTWTEAVVGRADRIIPPANQLTAWYELGTPVRETDDAHYQETLFNHYLQDRWTNA